jgi:dTDP-4-amino-4,6-dideoxygalactose transaminase
MHAVPFYKTTHSKNEQKYITELLNNSSEFLSRPYSSKSIEWIKDRFQFQNFFLTKSCTQSLELAAILLDIKADDEVILPSYAYVACASAFVLRGAKCVFVDVEQGTMNIDADKIEAAITSNTKAIVTINYSGISCNYELISAIASKHNLFVIEDNAHGFLSKYQNKFLGSFGDISTFSFDHLKNITCGQGGAIAINNPTLLEKFSIHYEQGTNRIQFSLGKAPNYEWKNVGSNYILSELNAAMLFAQLEETDAIVEKFKTNWNLYVELLKNLEITGSVSLPQVPNDCEINGYNFYIKTESADERKRLISHLKEKQITAQFHYVPLHSSSFGKSVGKFSGLDKHTSMESEKLLRLPHYFDMNEDEINYVVNAITEFYQIVK